MEALGGRLRLVGDLAIRGTRREVTLDVEYAGRTKDPWVNERAGITARTSIDRKDFGLSWNVALETGGWLVSDEISVDIQIELVKTPEQQPEAAEPVAA